MDVEPAEGDRQPSMKSVLGPMWWYWAVITIALGLLLAVTFWNDVLRATLPFQAFVTGLALLFLGLLVLPLVSRVRLFGVMSIERRLEDTRKSLSDEIQRVSVAISEIATRIDVRTEQNVSLNLTPQSTTQIAASLAQEVQEQVGPSPGVAEDRVADELQRLAKFNHEAKYAFQDAAILPRIRWNISLSGMGPGGDLSIDGIAENDSEAFLLERKLTTDHDAVLAAIDRLRQQLLLYKEYLRRTGRQKRVRGLLVVPNAPSGETPDVHDSELAVARIENTSVVNRAELAKWINQNS